MTEASYYSFGFSYGVEVTLTSPTGAATTQMSNWYPTYASYEIWMPWNYWYGTWFVSTRHITWNWYQNWFYNYYSSYSGPVTNIGFNELGYKDGDDPVAGRCTYSICDSYRSNSCFFRLTRSTATVNNPNSGPGSCPLGLLRLLDRTTVFGTTVYCTVRPNSDQFYRGNFCQ